MKPYRPELYHGDSIANLFIHSRTALCLLLFHFHCHFHYYSSSEKLLLGIFEKNISSNPRKRQFEILFALKFNYDDYMYYTSIKIATNSRK